MAEEGGRESNKSDRTEIRKGQREQGEEEEVERQRRRGQGRGWKCQVTEGPRSSGIVSKGFSLPQVPSQP